MPDSNQSESCEIIIPVYNSLSQTKRCIESVLKHSSISFHLILVNDRSNRLTTEYLQAVASKDERVVLLENKENKGFLHTVNRGLSHSDLQSGNQPLFKLILNSDTIVTPGWLEAFCRCFRSDKRIGLATAMSNNAENLSIPIPEGEDYLSFANSITSNITETRYPDITTAVGFCMAFRTEVLREVGLFDSVFGAGYAEDSDYHFKAISEGWRSVLVDDCFVYHESHASFSDSKGHHVAGNRPLFDTRWLSIYQNELAHFEYVNPIDAIKSKLARSTQPSSSEYDVLFVLPTAQLCGGVIVVYEIVEQLLKRGIRANAIVLEEPKTLESPLTFSPFFIPEGRWHDATLPKAKIFVATHYQTVPYAALASLRAPQSQTAYLIQGYEGWFPNAHLSEVSESYTAIPNRIVVSTWLQKMLSRWNADATCIGNGVDSSFFVPRDSWKDPTPTKRLFIMLRDDPQGSLVFGKALLEKLSGNPAVEVVAIGEASTRPELYSLVSEGYGRVDRRMVAKLLSSCDIAVDCSMVQGFGMLGLEAMSSGVATVLTHTGGVREYANEKNSLLVPVGDSEALHKAVLQLLQDDDLLIQLKEAGRRTAESRDWGNIGGEYGSYFGTLLSQSSSHSFKTSDQSAHALIRHLVERIDSSQERSQLLDAATNFLTKELQQISLSRSAEQVLKENLTTEQYSSLTSTREAAALFRLFEAARSMEQRLENRLDAYRDGLASRNLSAPSMPLLEKAIELSYQPTAKAAEE